MTARVSAPVKVSYPKHWFVVGLVLYAPVVALLAYLAHSSVEDLWKAFWLVVCAAFAALFALFLIPPLFTGHLAGERSLRLRMGLLMNAAIPYSWIRDVRDAHVRRGSISVGIGVRYAPMLEAVFVTSSFMDLVSLRLDGPHSLGRRGRPPVSQIVLSVSDKAAFVRLVRERAGLQGAL